MCLKCNVGKNQCQYCDLSQNRIVEIDRCVTLQYPNCKKYQPDASCIKCDENYYLKDKVCVKKSSDIQIENCKIYISETVCKECIDQYYLKDGKCVSVPEQIEGCQIYKDDNYQVCSLCKDDYNLTRDQSICIKKPNVKNCQYFSFIKCLQCDDNYIENKNLYLKYFFDLSNTSKRQTFWERLFINQPLKVNSCEKVEIQNCKEYINYKQCKICQNDYYLEKGLCIAFPQEPIQNCITYEEKGKTCTECEQGFNIVNNLCIQVTSIQNCKFYFTGKVNTNQDSKCIECESNYYTKDNKCQIRNKTISNCLQYIPDQEKCQQCSQGFVLTSDNLACLQQINNCLIYQISNEFTTKLACDTCIDGMTYQLSNTQCEKGTINECVKYGQNNTCSQCSFKFYTDTQQCFAHNEITDCLAYDFTKKNFCKTCQTNTLLLTQTTKCSQSKKIENCVTYRKVNECGECILGYYLQTLENDPDFTNKCVEIEASKNCLQLDGQKNCQFCKEKTVADNGLCKFTIDVQEEYCQKHNLNGKNTYKDFQCEYCEYQTYPVNLNKYYACTHESNVVSSVLNCTKYNFNEISQNYFCEACKEGYFLQDNSCKQKCGVNAQDNQTYPVFIQLDKSGVSDNYTQYKIKFTNICIEIQQTQVVNNCELYYPDIYFQTPLKSTSDYVCIKCASNSIPIIKRLTSTNKFTFNLQEQINGPLLTYAGFDCITLSLETIISENKVDNKVQFCDVYYNVKRKESLDLYGCLKCQFGYSGITTVSENDKYYGYIDKCDKINDITNIQNIERDGKCDMQTRYQGYTLYKQQIEWNQTPLETYLSCFKCQNLNEKQYRPFIFLNFEDTTSPTNFSYNSFENKLSNIIPLQSYGFDIFDKQIILMNESGGRSIRCMTLNPSNFILTDDQFKILGNLDSVLTKNLCALFIVNVSRKPNASESYLEYPSSLDKASVYCGACQPGYKAFTQGKLQQNTTVEQKAKIYLPYYVYKCEKINNCQENGNWVNFCEKCNTGFAWLWDNDNKTILYDTCQQSTIKFCISVDDRQVCKACQKGFEITNGVCDKIIPPFCHQDETIYDRYFPANSQQPLLGRNYLYLRNYPTGCNKCRDGYVSMLQIDTSDIYHQFICSQSYYLQKINITNESYFIQNCKNYYIANTLSQTLLCKICNIDYVITTDGICKPQNEYKNCQLIKKIENSESYQCVECQAGFIFLLGKCVKGTIEKCIEYDFNQASTKQTCKTCSDGYYSVGDSCKIGNVQNCLKFNSEFNCKECLKNYYIINIKNNTNICIQIPESFNCQQFDNQSLQDRKLTCSLCKQDHVQQLLLSDEISYCLQKDKIENCQKYDIQDNFSDSTFKCIECQNLYFLDSDNQKCIQRKFQDQNCENFELLTDTCKKCKKGYYLSDNKQQCIINPQGIKGCITYTNATTCTKCNQNMYLSFNKCIEVEQDKRISNCVFYGSLTSCIQCESQYYVNNNLCSKSAAENCLIAESSTKCLTCPENFGFKKNDETLVLSCVEKTDKSCLVSTDTFPFECQKCKKEFYLDEKLKKCIEKEFEIKNCIAYKQDQQCQICDKGYLLSIDNKECIKTNYYDTLIDQNCKEQKILSEYQCTICEKGFYFDDQNNCVQCDKQNLENGCAYCNVENQELCTMCNTGYFQNNESKCIQEQQNNNEDKGVGNDTQVTESSKLFLWSLLKIFVFKIVFLL